MSSKPVANNPSGFPLLCCSTKCPQTFTAQQGTGSIQVLSLPLAPGGLWLSMSDNQSVLLGCEGEEPGKQTPYQLSGQQQGGHERLEHCWQGPGGAALASGLTGAWHLAFPGSLKEEKRGNPQIRTSWQGKTASCRQGVGVVARKGRQAPFLLGSTAKRAAQTQHFTDTTQMLSPTSSP